ncbi:MAG: ribonuclease HII [Cyanobacteria bacterium P01_H01_bin.74]
MTKKTAALTQLLQFDSALLASFRGNAKKNGQNPQSPVLIGVDEVGRGSIVSDVFACAVCLPAGLSSEAERQLQALNDSKLVSEKQRMVLASVIAKNSWFALGTASQHEVDRLNIHHASLLALSRAVRNLCNTYLLNAQTVFIAVDGCYVLPGFQQDRQMPVIKGDRKSACIAAASIVAKVRRDAWITALSEIYPVYEWHNNKGYPTPKHLAMISAHGPSPLHRQRAVQNYLSKVSAR